MFTVLTFLFLCKRFYICDWEERRGAASERGYREWERKGSKRAVRGRQKRGMGGRGEGEEVSTWGDECLQ